MMEENNNMDIIDKITELVILFSDLSPHKREIILEMARIMSDGKKE